MAVDMFLKIDGIKGESMDSKHKDEVNLLAWSFGATQSGGAASTGAGAGAGKVHFQDISVTKYIDRSSADLLLYCANGKHIKQVDLAVRKAGEKPLEYLKIKLTDVIVTSYQTGGSGGEDRLTENVSLNFSKIDVTYTPQSADGKELAAAVMKWDIKQNISA